MASKELKAAQDILVAQLGQQVSERDDLNEKGLKKPSKSEKAKTVPND